MQPPLAIVLTLHALERATDPRSFERGMSYFRSGAVERLDVDPTQVRAEVRGTQRYRVRLAVTAEGKLDHACSCPIGVEGDFCKHAVAVGLAFLEKAKRANARQTGVRGATREKALRASESPAAESGVPSAGLLFPHEPPIDSVASSPPPADVARPVALALALLWTYRPRTAVHSLLGLLGFDRSDRRPYTQDDVKRAIAELRERGWLSDMPGREGYVRLQDNVRGPLYRALLDSIPVHALRNALHQLDRFRAEALRYGWPLYDLAATVALVRLELFAGTSAREIGRVREVIERGSLDWNDVIRSAAFSAFDAELFERITPEWRWGLAYAAVVETSSGWGTDLLPVCEWALAQLAADSTRMPEHLRLALAEFLLHRGEPERARSLLEKVPGGAAAALRACVLVQEGHWSEAQLAFEAAIRVRQAEVGARKRVFPASIAWLYPLALLAQRTRTISSWRANSVSAKPESAMPTRVRGGGGGCMRSARAWATLHWRSTRSRSRQLVARTLASTRCGNSCSRLGSAGMPWAPRPRVEPAARPRPRTAQRCVHVCKAADSPG
ncbi:MAG: SWIM zinc finger family protein [Casimicrobiaceae bacterium]